MRFIACFGDLWSNQPQTQLVLHWVPIVIKYAGARRAVRHACVLVT